MTDLVQRISEGDFDLVQEQELLDYVVRQRWFGSKSREVAHARVAEGPLLRSEPPLLVDAIVEIRFHPGTHDIYQVPLGFRPAEEGWSEGVVTEADGWTVYDALADPELARELVRHMRQSSMLEVGESALGFRALGGLVGIGDDVRAVRPMGVEQSNTSLVLDEQLVLKVYRRLEAGVNPELELLRFLTEQGFPNIASLHGWSAYWGRLMDATLSILQQYVPGESDGWTRALESLAGDPGDFLASARRLGEVTGAMHAALASDPTNPIFAPEEPSRESLALLTATIDEEIEDLFGTLPELDALDPIRGRGEEVRDQLRLISHIGNVGLNIRHHGDYHLGQVLWANGDWVVLDFEGEPARTLSERRRKRSPLRDVAGMLRSFGYAVCATRIEHGIETPPDWEERARSEFLDGYLPEVEPTGLLPRSQDAIAKLLGVFELEKALYELRYELNHRPDWVRVPVAGIVALLEGPREPAA